MKRKKEKCFNQIIIPVSCPHYLFFMWWYGQGRHVPLILCASLPMTDEGIRPFPLPALTLSKDSRFCSSPVQHTRVYPTEGVWVNGSKYEHGRSGQTPYLPYGGMGRGLISTSLSVAEILLRSKDQENSP